MTWENISLKQYIEVYNIIINDDIPQDEKLVLVTQLLYGVDVLNKPITEVKTYFNAVGELLTTEPSKMPLKDKYSINGITYKLDKQIEKITTAQFIDYTNITKEISINNYNEFLSIFLIPEGHTYNDGYDIRKVQNDIDNYLSIVEALSIADFFLRYSIHSLKIFRKYLRWGILINKEMSWKQKKHIIKQLNQIGDYYQSF